MSDVLKKLQNRKVQLRCRDLVSGAPASVRVTHQVLGTGTLAGASFLALANSGLRVQLFSCSSSPAGKIRSVTLGQKESVLSELREWLPLETNLGDEGGIAFDDIIPLFRFDEAADLLFTVPSGEFRDRLLLWDHEIGAPAEAVIANDLAGFVELILRDPIPLLESDVRFSCGDVADGTLSPDAQLIALAIEDR